VQRAKGTPQGGVVSPVLSNLFMHYTFDLWMQRTFPGVLWCRYADDGLVHCKTEQQALAIKAALAARLAECGLQLHPDKTRIVYCKDGKRRRKYPNTKFEFLGYDFRARGAKKRSSGELFTSFLPAVSKRALKSMRQATRARNFRNRTDMSLTDISHVYSSVLSGWWRYYGKFYPTAMHPVFYHFNKTLVEWAMRKYRRLKGHKERASLFLQGISKRQPRLFIHWTMTEVGWFA